MRFRNHKIFATFVTVPEAAVNKNNGFVFRQNNVGLARQVFYIHSVPETFAEKVFPHEKLGLGILSPDPRHVIAAGFFGMDVGHEREISLFSKVLFILVISNLREIEILKAIQKIREEEIPNHAQSSTYYVVYEEERFPSKLVIAYANIFANGENWTEDILKEGKARNIFVYWKKMVSSSSGKKNISCKLNLMWGRLKEDLEKTGLLFEDKLLYRFVMALLAKPFVMLTGLAGSGKTKLA